jgi:hypothetical protein
MLRILSKFIGVSVNFEDSFLNIVYFLIFIGISYIKKDTLSVWSLSDLEFAFTVFVMRS